MATHPTMRATAAVTAATNDYGTGTYTAIDEAIGSADGSEVGDDTNSTTTRNGRYKLGTLASDWASWNSVSFQVRYRVTGAQTNTRTLSVQIQTDEVSPVNLTNAMSLGTISNTTAQNSSVTAFTGVTGTKAQWQNACLVLVLGITKVKGGDTNGIRIDACDITGDYNAATGLNNKPFGQTWASLSKIDGVAVAGIAKVTGQT